MADTTEKQILIVDDEPDIARGLRDVLEFEGYAASVAHSGADAIDHIRREQPALVVLDVMLPDANGFDVCRQLHQDYPALAIIMLSARGEESSKIRGLEAGADDYVTKPFSVAELIARIKAVLRRRQDEGESEVIHHIGNAEIRFDELVVIRDNKQETMSAQECALLRYLITHVNKAVSREDILRDVWGLKSTITTRSIDNFILKLRKKIESNSANPQFILTIHGLGYKLIQ